MAIRRVIAANVSWLALLLAACFPAVSDMLLLLTGGPVMSTIKV